MTMKKNSRAFRHYATMCFGRCQWCNTELDLDTSTVDHVVALGNGGEDDWDNFAISCKNCNLDKASKSWGRPRFGPFPWLKPRKEARLKTNLWPATLTYTLNLPFSLAADA
jgi:5-methylcytosine-specific restriction endonuclease McrA